MKTLDVSRIQTLGVTSPDQVSVCEQLAACSELFDAKQAAVFSEVLGFDTRELVAASNIIAVSKAADSVSLETLKTFCRGLVATDMFVSFVRRVSEANSALDGTTYDSISGYIYFRHKSLNTREWVEYVLVDL